MKRMPIFSELIYLIYLLSYGRLKFSIFYRDLDLEKFCPLRICTPNFLGIILLIQNYSASKFHSAYAREKEKKKEKRGKREKEKKEEKEEEEKKEEKEKEEKNEKKDKIIQKKREKREKKRLG